MRLAARGDRGFTLIELLVVILVIAILAAIAIPTFLEQREKGFEAQMQSGLKNAATAVESWGTAHGGDFSALNTATNPDYALKLAAEGFDIPSEFLYLNVVVTGASYCIEARHAELTTSSNWRRSTYQQNNGGPQPTPDNCP
jgi:type IV pilus assembly protein PilA